MRLLFFSSFTPFMLVALLVLMLGAMLLFLRWRLRFIHAHPPVVPFQALPLKGHVVALSRSLDHSFSKTPVDRLTLIPGLGIEGDAHKGATVQHRSRLATRGHESNLRQVHLIHAELHSLLRMQGFKGIAAGKLGENILTFGLPLIDYPVGTRLFIGAETELEITGLRNPCAQLDTYAKGLMQALLPREKDGEIRRLCGVMAVIHKGGVIRCRDRIRVQLPPTPCRKLEVV